MPLFFYGTLRHLPLLEIVLGRPATDIDLRPATLPGYAVRSVAEGPFPGIEARPDARAEGVIVGALTPEDIARLDYYEGGFDYDLVTVTLGDGARAQVYLPAAGAWTLQGPWSLDDWVRDWGEMSCEAAAEVMGYFGQKSRDEIAGMFPMIRTRAMARVNARRTDHEQGTFRGRVDVTDRRRVYAKFFALDEFKLSHERFDGTMTPQVERAVFVSTDAAIVLPYDPVRDRVLLIEQMRMGPLARGDANVWQLEPVAGRIDAGETPEQTARRETREEAGLEVARLHPVGELYASPGNTTEFYYIYVAIADLAADVTGIGGLASETEDIRSHLMSFDDLMALCDGGNVANAPLMVAAYWLARHRDELRAKA